MPDPTHISLIGNDCHVREMSGFGPAAEVLLVRQKDPTTVALFETHHTQTPRPASSDWADANHGRARQLAALRQGPSVHESVHPWGRAAGVG